MKNRLISIIIVIVLICIIFKIFGINFWSKFFVPLFNNLWKIIKNIF